MALKLTPRQLVLSMLALLNGLGYKEIGARIGMSRGQVADCLGRKRKRELGDEVYGDLEATDILHREEPIRVRKRGSVYVLSLHLPFTDRTDLDVFRKGDELFVRVGPYKRNLILPQMLQRLDIADATFVEDRLEVRFTRAPALQAAGEGGSAGG